MSGEDTLRQQLREWGAVALHEDPAVRRDSAMRMVAALQAWLMSQPDQEWHDQDAVTLLSELVFALNDLDFGVRTPLLRADLPLLQGRPAASHPQLLDRLVMRAVEYVAKRDNIGGRAACAEVCKLLGYRDGDRRVQQIYLNRAKKVATNELPSSAPNFPAVRIETEEELAAAIAAIKRQRLPPIRRRREVP